MSTNNRQGKKQTSGLLWNDDPRLPMAEKISKPDHLDDNWLNKVEADFVKASIDRREWNKNRNRILLSLAFLGISGFAGYVWYQLQISEIREKAARAENLLQTDPVQGLVLAIQAVGQNRSTPLINQRILPETQSSLLSAAQVARESSAFTQNAQVNTIALSPDGKKVASSDGNGDVYLQDLTNNQSRQPLLENGSSSSILASQVLTFSPDGRMLLASGARDFKKKGEDELQPVQIWDLQQNSSINPFGSLSANVIAADFSPDARMIVSGGKDGTIRLWNLQGNQISQSPTISGSVIYAVAFSSDGKSIVSADGDRNVNLWQVQEGVIVGPPTLVGKCENSSGQAIPRSVAFNSNGQQIICNLVSDYSESGFDNKSFVTLWRKQEADQWQPVALQEGSSGFLSKILVASFSPDGHTIVTGDQDGSIRLWGSADKPLGQPLLGKPLGQPLLGHGSHVKSVAFSAGGKQIISSSWDGSIRLWDVEQNLSEQRFRHQEGYGGAVLSPDGQKVAIGSKDGNQGTITVWNIEDRQHWTISVGEGKEEGREGYREGETYAISNSGSIAFKDFRHSGQRNQLSLGNPELAAEGQLIGSPETRIGESVALSPDGQRIVSDLWDENGSSNRQIQLWDAQGHPIGQPVEVGDQGLMINSIAFSPDGQQIVSGSSNYGSGGASAQSSVCLLRVETGGLSSNKLCKTMLGDLDSLAFSPDTKMVAIGQSDGGLYLWNQQTDQVGQRFGGYGQPINSIAFSRDGKIIASGDRDGRVRLWNLDGTPIGEALESYTHSGKSVSSIVFDQDNTVIVGYVGGGVQSWNIGWENSLQVTCDRLHNHPVFTSPQTDVEEKARETCEKYVWSLQQTESSERISYGDKVLVSTLTNLEKQAGVEAIRNGDYATAIQYLEAYLKHTPNDPEALTYLNNARIGTEKSYTLAISAPIGSDVNGALEMLRGVAQAQGEVNQPGGINQIPVRVLIADDDNKPDTAQQIAEALVKNPDVLGVIGHYASDVTLATGKIYEAGKLTIISPVSTSVKLTGFSPSVFRTVPSDAVAARALADYVRSPLGKTNAAVFYNSTSGYSESLKSEFVKSLSAVGGQVSDSLIFDLSNPNFNAEQSVEQAIANGAEALVLLPNSAELDDALQVIKANNQRLPLLGGDDVYAPKTLEMGGASTEGMIVAVPWHILAAQTDFPTTSRQLWRADVNWRTAMSYDATFALIAGLNQTPTREGLAEVLRSPNFVAQGATGTIQFDAGGDRDRTIQLVEIQNTGAESRSSYGYDFVPVP